MNKVLFARLLLPKVAISPSATTECQIVNRFGHITNSVSVEKATEDIIRVKIIYAGKISICPMAKVMQMASRRSTSGAYAIMPQHNITQTGDSLSLSTNR